MNKQQETNYQYKSTNNKNYLVSDEYVNFPPQGCKNWLQWAKSIGPSSLPSLITLEGGKEIQVWSAFHRTALSDESRQHAKNRSWEYFAECSTPANLNYRFFIPIV